MKAERRSGCWSRLRAALKEECWPDSGLHKSHRVSWLNSRSKVKSVFAISIETFKIHIQNKDDAEKKD